MLNASTVRLNYSDIENVFLKYIDEIGYFEEGNIWKGISCNNFVNKAKELESKYKQNIYEQMTKFAEVIDKYKEYENNKQIQKDLNINIQNATDDIEKKNYQNQLEQSKSEMDKLREQINTLLTEIVVLVINEHERNQIESFMTGNYFFDTRKTKPKLGDKWYSVKDNGYISRNKNISDPQCTWYAQGRFNEISEITGNSPIDITGNANQMIKSAKNSGFATSNDINDVEAGDMLVYNHGIYGHVVIVEKVNEDGSYVTTSGNDSSNGGYFKVKERTYKNAEELSKFVAKEDSSYSFLGVIHQTKIKS